MDKLDKLEIMYETYSVWNCISSVDLIKDSATAMVTICSNETFKMNE